MDCKGHAVVYFDPFKFRELLIDSGLSVRRLGEKNQIEYIGWSCNSIFRAMKASHMPIEMYDALMGRIDISSCVIAFNSNLLTKIHELENENDKLREEIDILSQQLHIH